MRLGSSRSFERPFSDLWLRFPQVAMCGTCDLYVQPDTGYLWSNAIATQVPSVSALLTNFLRFGLYRQLKRAMWNPA